MLYHQFAKECKKNINQKRLVIKVILTQKGRWGTYLMIMKCHLQPPLVTIQYGSQLASPYGIIASQIIRLLVYVICQLSLALSTSTEYFHLGREGDLPTNPPKPSFKKTIFSWISHQLQQMQILLVQL